MDRNAAHIPDVIEAFVRDTVFGFSPRSARIALFNAVRDLPYATDAASDAATLIRARRGNCLAKADVLACGFTQLGYRVRTVRWLYRLPGAPAEVALLPSRDDVHTALEVFLGQRWRLMDATHDPPLAAIGLTVNDWEGQDGTQPAFVPLGPVWQVGVDNEAIASAVATIRARYTDDVSARALRYQTAFNRWLDMARMTKQSHSRGGVHIRSG